MVRSAAARRDINAITFYIGRRDPEAARRLIDRIDDVLRLLADRPRLGAAIPAKAGTRSFVVRPYVVLYHPIAGGIRLDRVLHGARDIANILDER